MSDALAGQSRAPGSLLHDAAPGNEVPSSAPHFSALHSGSSTHNDAGTMPNAPSFFMTQQQPQTRTPSTYTIPLTANNSSYSFSFCGSDAFGVKDAAPGSEQQQESPITPQPPQPPQLSPQQLARHFSATQNPNGGTALSSVAMAQPSTFTLNPMSLAAVNIDYFYGIPTPSAPLRTHHSTSNVSNCSSSHRQASTSGESSNHASSSRTHRSIGAEQGSGIQKDVLAFMAAEQQQQKFALQQRNVYMSGLPVDFRPSAFRAMCEVFGRIESSKLCMESDDANRCRGFGFVLYFDVESANSCIASLNGKVMQGRTLQVRRADLSAAPQPLNPVSQRNRTGSGLVTPPNLSQMRADTPATTNTFPLFNPHPPTGALNNAIASSMVMSNLPFTFTTPTMMGVQPTNIHNTKSSAAAAAAASSLTPLKGSSTNSSCLYGGPSTSSSFAMSSNPQIVYSQGATMMPAMRNGMSMMQMFTPCPPPANLQQQQQQQQLMSMPSASRSGVAASQSATPSSPGSSNANMGFVPAPSFHPQPPMTPASNVAFYRHALDGQCQPKTVSSTNTNTVSNTNNSFHCAGLTVPQPPRQQQLTAVSNLHTRNLLMQEYLSASGLNPNGSNSNIYSLFPQ